MLQVMLKVELLKAELLKASSPVHCGVVCVGVRLVTDREVHRAPSQRPQDSPRCHTVVILSPIIHTKPQNYTPVKEDHFKPLIPIPHLET